MKFETLFEKLESSFQFRVDRENAILGPPAVLVLVPVPVPVPVPALLAPVPVLLVSVPVLVPIFQTFLGDFTPDRLDSGSL